MQSSPPSEPSASCSLLGRSVVVLCLLLLPLSACGILDLGDDGPGLPQEGDTTLLFIGSSYLEFNDVPQRVKELARKAGHQVYVRRHTYLGQPLAYFAADFGTTNLIRERDWDYVVLQGGASSLAYPQGAQYSVYLAVRDLARKAREGGTGTRVIYMMPWAFEDGMLWVEGRTEDYAQMQLDIREEALDLAEDLDLTLAPVGMAFYEVLTTWDHGEHFLHDYDWNHASEKGSYLAAATFYSTIFAESCTDLDVRWKLQSDTAAAFRDVASRTVLDSLSLWNITW
jgi:hypothetical protein